MSTEARFRALVEHSADILSILEEDGRISYISPSVEITLGRDPEVLSGSLVFDLVHPEDIAEFRRAFDEPASTQEVRFRHLEGRWVYLETVITRYTDDPDIRGYLVNARNVTEQRKIEEQLRQSQKMDAVGRLAGGVAHDFNNLLTAINGYAELALARMDDADPLRTAVVEIRKAGKRAADLTRRLLTLSRHQMVSRRRLSLNRVVLDLEMLLRRVLGEDIDLATVLDPELGDIRVDQGQLEQLILNLGVNARDAMPDGGRLVLETRVITLPGDGQPPLKPIDPVPGGYALLIVRDTGQGMSEEVREKVFEPFFTTKEPGRNSGLGLSIVYSIVMQNKGYIELESDLGTGCTFHIYLPLMEEAEAIAEEEKIGGKMPGGRERVLLVEDEDAVRSLVKQVLVLLGYEVLEAADAIQAEMICDHIEGVPDLLLTDVVMPEKSGMALAEDLQARYPEIKILFMSGYTDSHTGVRLLTERRAAFLPKPFTPDVLARKVRDVIDGQV